MTRWEYAALTWRAPTHIEGAEGSDDPEVIEGLAKLNGPDAVGVFMRHGTARDRLSDRATVGGILVGLDMVGQEGWEVISTTGGNDLDTGVHWLRRPLSD